MTEQEAIEQFKERLSIEEYRHQIPEYYEAMELAVKSLEEIQQYRAIGTVEELQKAEKEEDILKFYYCDSEDSYLVGLRIDNFYYAHYIDGRWVFDMSRYLPWGEHVIDGISAWKGYTYPSEPREINFSEWLNGFIKKECGGTPEECRAAVDKQKAKKIVRVKLRQSEWGSEYRCPVCESDLIKTVFFNEDGTEPDEKISWCSGCGQKLDWSDEE